MSSLMIPKGIIVTLYDDPTRTITASTLKITGGDWRDETTQEMYCYDLSLEGDGDFNDKLSSMDIEWPSDIIRAKGYYVGKGGGRSQTITIDYRFETTKSESFTESEQLQLS